MWISKLASVVSYVFMMVCFGLITYGGYRFMSIDLLIGFWVMAIAGFTVVIMFALAVQAIGGEPLERISRKIANRVMRLILLVKSSKIVRAGVSATVALFTLLRNLYRKVVRSYLLRSTVEFVDDMYNFREPQLTLELFGGSFVLTVIGSAVSFITPLGGALVLIGFFVFMVTGWIIMRYILSKLVTKLRRWGNDQIARVTHRNQGRP